MAWSFVRLKCGARKGALMPGCFFYFLSRNKQNNLNIVFIKFEGSTAGSFRNIAVNSKLLKDKFGIIIPKIFFYPNLKT